MLRIFETHILPGFSAVLGFEDTIPIGHTSLVVVLACSHPQDILVIRVHGDTSDGVGALLVEDRCESGPGVYGFPDTAR